MLGKKLLVVLLALFLWSFTVRAQTSAFTYQGRLNDSNVAANGTYQMQFTIFSVPTGGSPIGSPVTNNSVAVVNGSFAVDLNFTTGPFLPGADRWLEIAVKKPADPGFITLSPRHPISSTPFAVKSVSAASADTLSNNCVGCLSDSMVSDALTIGSSGSVSNAALPAIVMRTTGATMTGGLITGNTINGSVAKVRTETSDTTPDVTNLTTLVLDYASPTTITDLEGEVDGQCVQLIAKSIVTINNSGVFRLNGNWVADDEDALTVCRVFSGWTETSRNMIPPPGVASAIDTDGFDLTGGIQTILSRAITVPTSGFVMVIGSAGAGIFHSNGAFSTGKFGVSDTAGAFQSSGTAQTALPTSAGSGSYGFPIAVQGVFQVPSAGSYTFYFLGQQLDGDVSVGDANLTLLFVPTSYGTVTPTLTGAASMSGDQSPAKSPAMKKPDTSLGENVNGGTAEQLKRQRRTIDELRQVVCELKPEAAICKEVNK